MLPWNALERLRDQFGDYLLVVRCLSCSHTCELSPAALAGHCKGGWDEPLAAVVARLRCRCGSRRIEVQLAFNRRPRGWNKHPS